VLFFSGRFSIMSSATGQALLASFKKFLRPAVIEAGGEADEDDSCPHVRISPPTSIPVDLDFTGDVVDVAWSMSAEARPRC
jgi:hypothetical protein